MFYDMRSVTCRCWRSKVDQPLTSRGIQLPAIPRTRLEEQKRQSVPTRGESPPYSLTRRAPTIGSTLDSRLGEGFEGLCDNKYLNSVCFGGRSLSCSLAGARLSGVRGFKYESAKSPRCNHLNVAPTIGSNRRV